MGKLMTTTGDILDSAVNHAAKMSMQSREIQQISHDLAIENLEKLDEYKSDLKLNYLEGLKNWNYRQQQEYLEVDEQDELEDFTPIKERGSSLYIQDGRTNLYLKAARSEQNDDDDDDDGY